MTRLRTIPTRCLLLLLAAVTVGWEKDRPAIPPVIPPNPGNLPKVLLIGDSLTGGYFKQVSKALEGRAVVAKSGDNGESTAVGVKKIDVWLPGAARCGPLATGAYLLACALPQKSLCLTGKRPFAARPPPSQKETHR